MVLIGKIWSGLKALVAIVPALMQIYDGIMERVRKSKMEKAKKEMADAIDKAERDHDQRDVEKQFPRP